MKAQLRKEILQKRKALDSREVEEKSSQILTRLISYGLLERPQVVMCYMDFRNEVRTEALIEYLLSEDKVVILPKVNPETQALDLFQIEGFRDMEISKFGILEPSDHLPTVLPSDIDLILAPGVAFDLKGYRMGYGAGFYDKLIPQIRPDCAVIGLAFDMQVVEALPVEDHDQPMNSIFTESRWIPAEENN